MAAAAARFSRLAAARLSRAPALLASRSPSEPAILVRGHPKTRGRRLFVSARPYCTVPPGEIPASSAEKIADSSAEKIDQILELLKSRGGCSAEEFMKLQETISKLEAKVYYGGILLGALAAAALTFPAIVNGLQNESAIGQKKQEDTNKAVISLDQRVKAVEDALKIEKMFLEKRKRRSFWDGGSIAE